MDDDGLLVFLIFAIFLVAFGWYSDWSPIHKTQTVYSKFCVDSGCIYDRYQYTAYPESQTVAAKKYGSLKTLQGCKVFTRKEWVCESEGFIDGKYLSKDAIFKESSKLSWLLESNGLRLKTIPDEYLK